MFNAIEVPCCPPSLPTFVTHCHHPHSSPPVIPHLHHPLLSPIIVSHPPTTSLLSNTFKGVLSTSLSPPCVWTTLLGPGWVLPHMYASHLCILTTSPCLLSHTRRA